MVRCAITFTLKIIKIKKTCEIRKSCKIRNGLVQLYIYIYIYIYIYTACCDYMQILFFEIKALLGPPNFCYYMLCINAIIVYILWDLYPNMNNRIGFMTINSQFYILECTLIICKF